jgi:hypothetical protein
MYPVHGPGQLLSVDRLRTALPGCIRAINHHVEMWLAFALSFHVSRGAGACKPEPCVQQDLQRPATALQKQYAFNPALLTSAS